MPFTSRKQQRWGHTPAGEKALGGPEKVAEWDSATKGRDLPMYAKGSAPKEASFASGGPVLPRTGDWKKTVPNRGFLNSPDQFTDGRLPPSDKGSADDPEQQYGKGAGKSNPKPADKSEKPVKPRG
jgi:hypothetical protein